jgi:chitin disaccharide deacetylase
MKYLIVNGDDFGASPGINRGIQEAHERGILTSTSLIVNGSSADQAARVAKAFPDLSIGLHAVVDDELKGSPNRSLEIGPSLRRQLRRFEELIGRPPTHLDSHHNAHRDARALPHFLDAAREYHLPLREHSGIRYISKFYGQWGGQTHLEHVGVDSLKRILVSEVGDGLNELGCHPGYVEASHPTSYRVEREAELRTLCDPRIRRALSARRITLIGYDQARKFL